MIKYKEKNYLCEYDLDTEIFDKFNIEVYDLLPLRGVFILSTKNDKKILKKISYSLENLNFIVKSLEYISLKYKNVMKINKDVNGNCYVKFNNDIYILIDLIEGREASFSNSLEIGHISSKLAEFHNSSFNIYGNLNVLNKEHYIKTNIFFDYLKNSLNELLKLKERVDKYTYKNKFDNEFIKNVDYYVNEIKECILFFPTINYEAIIKKDGAMVLCHNDLAYHNIIIKDEEVYLLDFDYCDIDLRVKDLANFAIKVLKNLAFDFEVFDIILNAYTNKNQLSLDEYKLLYLYMKFPKDFYVISMNYYYKQKKWDEEVYLSRFLNKIDYKNYTEDFYNQFKGKFL